jgi:hypothetical protein
MAVISGIIKLWESAGDNGAFWRLLPQKKLGSWIVPAEIKRLDVLYPCNLIRIMPA